MPRPLLLLLAAVAALPAAHAVAGEVEARLPFLAKDGERHVVRPLQLPGLPVREADGITDEEELELSGRIDTPRFPSLERMRSRVPCLTRESASRHVWDEDDAEAGRAAKLVSAVKAGCALRVRLEVTVLAGTGDHDAARALDASKPRVRLRRDVSAGAVVEMADREEATFPTVAEVDNGGAVTSMARYELGPRLVASAAPAGDGRWVVRLSFHDAVLVSTTAFGGDPPSAVAPELAFTSFSAELAAAPGRAERVVADGGDPATAFVIAYRVTPHDPPDAPSGTRVERLEAVRPLFVRHSSAWRPGDLVDQDWEDELRAKRFRHRPPAAWEGEGLTLHYVYPGLLVAEGSETALGEYDRRVAAWWRDEVRAAVLGVTSRDEGGTVVRRFAAPLVTDRPFRLLQGRLVPAAQPRAEASVEAVAVGARIHHVLTGRMLEVSGQGTDLRVEELSATADPRSTEREVHSTVWGEETRRKAPLSLGEVTREHWAAGDASGRHGVRVRPWEPPR